MDKKNYIIIALVVIIIVLLSYNAITIYKSSEPEVFVFSDYVVTAPAGTHYHNNTGQAFYLDVNGSDAVFMISAGDDTNMSAQDFDLFYDSIKNNTVSKSDLITAFESDFEYSGLKDINVGDFKGEPEVSMLFENPDNHSEKGLIHFIKHKNKIFMVGELLDNSTSAEMYNNLILT